KAGIRQQQLELCRLRERVLASLDAGGVRSEGLVKRAHERVCPWRPLDRAVDAQCGATGVSRDATHFPERASLLRKESQPEVTKPQVKAAGRNRQVERAALDPVDRRSFTRNASRDRQHPRVQVETCQLFLTDSLGRQTCYDPRAASDIENGLSCAR